MWALIAVVIKLNSLGEFVPVYDKLLRFDSLKKCELSMQQIYKEYKILQTNYPVEIEFKYNDNNQKYMMYSYKPDYTKSKITTYYHCLKLYSK